MISIKNKADCCGCSACYSICPKKCIEMKPDNEGFLYPNVDISECIDCHMCERVCPILNPAEEKPFNQNGYVVQNKDEQVLRESTSGGAFTPVAEYVLNHDGIVFGAVMNDDFTVRHEYVDNINDLNKFRNSKYVQSSIGGGVPTNQILLSAG